MSEFDDFLKKQKEQEKAMADALAEQERQTRAAQATEAQLIEANKDKLGVWLSWLVNESIRFDAEFAKGDLHLYQSGVLDEKSRRKRVMLSAGSKHNVKSQWNQVNPKNSHLVASSTATDSSTVTVAINETHFETYGSLDDSMTPENAKAIFLALFEAAYHKDKGQDGNTSPFVTD